MIFSFAIAVLLLVQAPFAPANSGSSVRLTEENIQVFSRCLPEEEQISPLERIIQNLNKTTDDSGIILPFDLDCLLPFADLVEDLGIKAGGFRLNIGLKSIGIGCEF